MAIGRSDIQAIEHKRMELESNLKEIKDCEFSFTWVLDRLEDWPSETDVGSVVERKCRKYSRLLQATIKDADQLLLDIDTFIEKQRKINSETPTGEA